MAEMAISVDRSKRFGLASIGVSHFASLLVLVFVVPEMLCSDTAFMLAIRGHRSPTELQWHHDHQKNQQKTTHRPIVAIATWMVLVQTCAATRVPHNGGMNRNVLFALLAAALFGASTPVAKLLVGNMSPVLLAGLLYLGSGLGLTLIRLVRDRGWQPSGLKRAEWPWLLGAIFFGGVAGPVALMFGLMTTSGSSASLLLNLEAVLTAAIAWVVFKENADQRIVLGMVAIVAGGLVLSWPTQNTRSSDWMGPVLVGVACLCWAIDNNLTRKVSASDALFIAGSKGVVAGLVNTALAMVLGAVLPNAVTAWETMTVGLLGYGFSLVLFVLALRGLGTARTGAYFSTAPFIGAFLSLVVFGESAGSQFWIAALLMGGGVWLHLTEHHEHPHEHEPLEHEHLHTHDLHHQHEHDFAWSGTGAHAHVHAHARTSHSHAHFPDIHHQHGHESGQGKR